VALNRRGAQRSRRQRFRFGSRRLLAELLLRGFGLGLARRFGRRRAQLGSFERLVRRLQPRRHLRRVGRPLRQGRFGLGRLSVELLVQGGALCRAGRRHLFGAFQNRHHFRL